MLGVAIWSGRYDALVWEAPTSIQADVKFNSTTTIKREIKIYTGMMNWQGELFITIGKIECL